MGQDVGVGWEWTTIPVSIGDAVCIPWASGLLAWLRQAMQRTASALDFLKVHRERTRYKLRLEDNQFLTFRNPHPCIPLTPLILFLGLVLSALPRD